MKAFISFFFQQPKKKKAVKVAPSKRKRGQAIPDIMDQDEELVPHADETSNNIDETLEVVHEVGDDHIEGVLDDRKDAHDLEAVRSVKKQALALAASDHQLTMDKQEERDALSVFPKVSSCISLAECSIKYSKGRWTCTACS
jgi:esterase/lipase